MKEFPTLEQSNNPEERQECIPSSEEIRSLFEKLLEGKEFETIRILEDERRLYL